MKHMPIDRFYRNWYDPNLKSIIIRISNIMNSSSNWVVDGMPLDSKCRVSWLAESSKVINKIKDKLGEPSSISGKEVYTINTWEKPQPCFTIKLNLWKKILNYRF